MTANRIFSIAELAMLPDQLADQPVGYELIDGQLNIMAPPGEPHGAFQSNLSAFLKIQGEWTGHGRVRSEVGLILSRNPDTTTVPDLVFIANKSLPTKRSSERYIETIPEIVVEVRSPSETTPKQLAKIERYLKAGVDRVWIVDEFRQVVEVHCMGEPVLVLQPTDTLTAGEIIPGFAVSVADILRE